MRDAVRGGGCGSDAEVRSRPGLAQRPALRPECASRAEHEHELLRAADLVRVGLAGTLRDYEMTTAVASADALDRIDYGDQPAGYVSQPGEVVNYVENHDNQTLFDINVVKLPVGHIARGARPRAGAGQRDRLLSQGVAYLHAGHDMLRSKSLDRNSYDSGDWFNRIDWSQDNHFASGLPPAGTTASTGR